MVGFTSFHLETNNISLFVSQDIWSTSQNCVTVQNKRTEEADGMREKILIIDPNPFTLSIIKQVMESAGYKVLTALDGESGLQQFYERQPTFIILDIMLPNIDGWEICRRIRKVSNVPIIVHTALGSQKNIFRALKIGVDDYLVKPVVPEVIQIRVEAVLNHRAQLEQLGPQQSSRLSFHQPALIGQT